MSTVKIQGNVNGTGAVTIAAPNTDSDVTVNLPATPGTLALFASLTNNGVAYVNGSGQPTSGSALTFDGTTVKSPILFASSTDASGSVLQVDTSSTVYGRVGGSTTMGFVAGTQQLWTIGGSEGMRLTSTGLGIGTSSPTTRFEVVGAGTAGSSMIVTGSSATNNVGKYGFYAAKHYTNSTAPLGLICGETAPSLNVVRVGGGFGEVTAATSIEFYTAANNTTTTGTERARIDSIGRVGINTSSPTAQLVVRGAGGSGWANGARNTVQLLNTGSAGNNVSNSIMFGDASIANRWEIMNDVPANGTGANVLSFINAGDERVRIDANGNLVSNYDFECSYNTRGLLLSKVNVGPKHAIRAVDGDLRINDSSDGFGSIQFWTAGLERARFDINGRFNVGVTSNPLSNSPGLFNCEFGSGDAINFKHAANGNNAINIWQTGTNSFNALTIYKGNSQTQVGYINCTTSGTTYNSGSDYRIKTNVRPMTNGLDRVLAMKPSLFTMIADNTESEGFIAHELQEVAPVAVAGEKDAVYKDGTPKIQGVDYGRITPILVAAIQELKAQVDAQAAEIAALKGTV